MNFKYIITLILVLTVSFLSNSQENFEDTKKIADTFFEDEKYLEATPYYLRLLAVQPRDHDINFHYGACMLHNTGKSQDVFKYLNYAVTNETVNPEVNFFLGRAYHLNFQFNDAVKYYKIYQLKVGEKAKESFDVKRQIEMCENGKKLITTITEMVVLDKKEIEKDKFFRIYDLSDIGGNLLVTAEFQTKLDIKKEHTPLIHFPANPTVIYYSSYGDNGKTGKDIYVQRRLPTGGWGLPQALKGYVNTKYDEEYPYMHPDGKYLYFSSKGHNSMGGFDVFRCKYDPETDMFGKAENMDFAVSSPNDDLFYVVDSLNKNAYFGSNRQSEEGKLFVYKVRVDRVPLNMSVIKGEFNSTINPQMKKVFIDVKDYSNGDFIGNFNSNEKGVYIITFPKGGKYEFTIKVGENKQEFKYLASIPFQKEFKPLKQKIIHELQGANENVRVIDLFNEEVEDPQGVFAQVIKMKSELKPNVSAEELAKMDKELKDKQILKVLGLDKLSLVEVGYLLDEKVKAAKKAEGGTKDIENKIYAQILDNTVELKRLDALINDKIAKANAATSDKRKYKLLKEAERALKLQEEIKFVNVKSLKLADSLAKNPSKGSSDKTLLIAKFSEHFNELLKENKQAEAYSYLADNKDAIKEIVEEQIVDPLQELIEKGLLLDEEILLLQPKDDQYEKDLRKIDSDIAEMERAKNGAKKKEIEELDVKIKSKRSERTMIEEERNFNGSVLKDKITERSAIRKKVDVLEGIYAVKSDKIVTKEELDLALASSNTINTTEVRSKISDQIAQLVLTSPDVKAVDYEDLEKDLGSVVTNSRGKSDRIKNDATLSPEEKTNKLKSIDRELLSSINNEILAAKKAYKSNPNDSELKRKLDALQTAKTLVSSSLDLPEGDDAVNEGVSENVATTSENTSKAQVTTTAGQNSATNSVQNSSTPLDSKGKANLIESVNSSYTDQVAAISSNGSLSESEKLQQLQQADKSLLTFLNKEISSVESALKSKPNDAVLLKKLADLKSVQSETQSKIDSRESLISNASSTTPLDSKGKANLIESVNSSYTDQVAAISSNGSLSESEKLQQLQQADKSLLTSLNKEISSVESALKSKPNDAVLLKKLADLKSVQSEIGEKVSAREVAITNSRITNGTTVSSTNSSTSLDSKTKASLIESVNSSYDDKIAQINGSTSLSGFEKLTQFQKADQELLKSISDVVSSLETSLAQNPANISLAKKIKDLKSIQSELELSVKSREVQISANNSSPLVSIPLDEKTKASIIETVNSSYNEEVSKINSTTSFSENEKLTQLQVVDKSLISALEKAIVEVEANLKKSPDNLSFKKKEAELKAVVSDVKETMTTRENVLSSSNQPLSAKAKIDLIDGLSPMYSVKVSEINKNSSLSTTEKRIQLQKSDKELIALIDKEVLALENNVKNNNDPQLIKDLADLKSVKKEVETAVIERDKLLNGTTNSPISSLTAKEKETLIESINSSYNENVVAIRMNTKLSEAEKNSQLIEADKKLLTAISSELSKVESSLKTNPSDQTLVDKVANLERIKLDIEAAITDRELSLASVSSSKPVDAKVKSDIIKSINSKYDKNVDAINNNNELSVTEKLDKLQTVDYSLVEGLKKEISSIETALAKNSLDAVLIQKLEDLNAVKSEVEKSIASRESVIASSSSSLDAKSKAELIETISSSYNEKVSVVKENTYLLDSEKQRQLQTLEQELKIKLEEEIASLEKTLQKDPSNALNQRKLKGLNEVKLDIEKSISSREKIISPSEVDHALASKSQLIETFSPDYNEKVADVKGHAIRSQVEKLEELQKLDTELVALIDAEVIKATVAAKKKSKDEVLKTAKSDLIELQTLANTVISERAKEIEMLKSNSVTESQKNELIANVKPDYASIISDISKAKYDHAKELQELIKEENSLLSKLEVVEKSIFTEVNSSPQDAALKTKLTVAISSKIDSQNKIDDLTKQAETLEARDIDQTALIFKIDPTFESDVAKSLASSSSTKSKDLANREVSLQEKIQAHITENNAKIATSYSLELAAENQILSQKLKESTIRNQSYNKGVIPSNDIALDPKSLELRIEVLGKSASEIAVEHFTIEDLQAQENVVLSYIDLLTARIEKVNKEVIANSSDQKLLDQQSLYETELKITENKAKSITAKIEKLENSTNNKLSSPELTRLTDEENSLKKQLDNEALSKKEKVALEKLLTKVQVSKSIESNKLITENLVVRKTENDQKSTQLKQLAGTSEISKVSVDLANSQNTRLTAEADALVVKSVKTKDPIAKNELLTQAIEKQSIADEIVQVALEENATRLAIKNEVSTLDTKEDLEQKKRKYSIEIGEITNEIDSLTNLISGMKPKKTVELVKKKEALEVEKGLTEKQLVDVEKQLAEIKQTPTTISASALEETVSVNEETRLITSKDYLEYSINANKALRIEGQILENEKVLDEKRQIAKELIALSVNKKSAIADSDVKQSIQNVKVVEEAIKSLKVELAEKQSITDNLLAKNPNDALRMQNLVKRGVEPEFNETLALIEQQRTPAVGLIVVEPSTPINTYSESNPIPVDVKNPAGLVYRIQVGAFSKPILQDMYKSFNPVSGEKLPSGVTRYMAGYFNNSTTVDEAFGQVKTLGYSDAFIVAYCDDQRISVAEARKLETTGQCVSTESREFVIAMSKTATKAPVNVSDLSYNQAPGAAKAIAVEAYLGLFFTVQIGVYNKPASSNQLKNIDPVVSKRLSNGQIRYSSGMFTSVSAAKPKKGEAVAKGVKDAFITAYYKGERLTLSQAAAVLKENGTGVLEKIDAEMLASVSNKESVSTKENVVATSTKASKDEVASYNKAPGAVAAKAVEAHLGLFFTVQIGVYSKPASSKSLNYITPLITKKLPNGQLRYSSGMFQSIEAAEPKRKEVLVKGVHHAYITAYYKGERITLAEAKELLVVNGDGILEKLDK